MTLGINVTIRTGLVDLIKNAIDAGGGQGKIKFYDDGRPVTGGALSTQTLLGTVLCAIPCGTSSAGVLTFSAFTDDDTADASGVTTWARITDSNDVFVADCSVGTVGADITLNSTSIVLGGIIRITDGTLTAGNA